MKSKVISLFSIIAITGSLLAGQAAPAWAALCGKCRELMFTDSQGKCIVCGGPTASAALQLCPKCSAQRHQCEHCLAQLSDKDLSAAEATPAAPSPPGTQPEDPRPLAPATPATGEAGHTETAAPFEQGATAAAPPPAVSPDLPPPTNNGPEAAPPSAPATSPQVAAPARIKPIHPARPGTYTSGKWRFQMQINAAGTRGEGRWGWLTYDGQKLPRGNINDYYETPWGPMYWVDAPAASSGLHGFMPIPSPQNPRRGRELLLPASLSGAPTAASAAAVSPALPAAPKVQTLEINRSQNGQLARLHVGNVLIIHLAGNPASGYQWQAGTSNTKVLRLTVRPQYAPSSGNAATGTYTFVYEAAQPGSGYLRLYYVRPGDPNHPRDAFAIGVNVSATASQSARSARRETEAR